MSILPFSRGIPDSVQRVEPMVQLTPLGQNQVARFEGSGDGFRVMAALSEHGACTVTAVARASGIDQHKAKIILRALIRERLVQRVN